MLNESSVEDGLTLAILAGGKGFRLGGAAKGLLLYEGVPLIARALVLGELAQESIIVSSDPAYDRFGLRRVEDVESGRGAPGGVVTALLACRTPWALVVACDMPFVTLDAVRMLLAAGKEDVICFTRDGENEPLLAIYRASLGARWRPQLASNPSLRGLLATVGVRALAPQDPHTLDSINTAEQLAT